MGGSGALRVCAELLSGQGITRLYIPNPSWANHRPLMAGGGFTVEEYPYLDLETHTVDLGAMLAAIRAAPAKSAILFQVGRPSPWFPEWRRPSLMQMMPLYLRDGDRMVRIVVSQAAAHNPKGVDLTHAPLGLHSP